jgi:coenzyme F420-reducing hydrogenase alpha subunit
VKRLDIDPLTRIEGQARVILEMRDDGSVKDACLQVMELRGFEKILTGMEIETMPLVTARICGICPVSHSLASAKAVDAMFGVEPPAAGRLLRELLNLAAFIQSHALHFFFLAAPDLVLGIGSDASARNMFGLLEAQPQLSADALRLRSLGQKMVEILGARGVHQVTAVGGGMAYCPTEEEFDELLGMATEALELSRTLAGFGTSILDGRRSLVDMFEIPSFYMGLVKDGVCNMYDGALRVVDSAGGRVATFRGSEYAQYVKEEALPNSYMKATYFDDDGELKMYQVGSLARLNVADSVGTPLAQEMLEELREKHGRLITRPVLFNYARLVELVHACERCLELLEDERIFSDDTREPLGDPVGEVMHGVGVVEAPRGLLIHEYETDELGRVARANLIVATQQNNLAINEMIRECAARFSLPDVSEDTLLNGIEFGIRCFDPCMSCATHAVGRMALEVVLCHRGEVLKTFGRRR